MTEADQPAETGADDLSQEAVRRDKRARLIDDLLARERPEFVVVSVPWDASPAAIRELVARGVKVLCNDMLLTREEFLRKQAA